MRVLVACEFSGVVRDAFIARGHEAVSCDLLPTEKPGPHIQGDVLDVLDDGWDLMVAHPPCTYLALSSAPWLYLGKGTSVRNLERWAQMEAGAEFFKRFLEAPVPRIAVENPLMHGHALDLIGRTPNVQTVQPWQFGHPETKTTRLWLKRLPPLVPTRVVVREWAVDKDGNEWPNGRGKHDSPTHYLTGRDRRELHGPQREQWERIHKEPPGPDRWKNRSRTYKGIAEAMAEQWGAL